MRAVVNNPNGTRVDPMTKTFLIAGAAGGLGRQLVELALRAGNNVLAADLVPEAVPTPAGHGDRLRVCAVDVTSGDAARAAVQSALGEFGGLDVLVNTVGQRIVGSIEDMPEDEFHRSMEINFFGAVNMVRAALPVMRKQRSGRIVNVSTIGGRRAQPGLAAYQSAKWALGGFTEILARELEPVGVHATLIEPGGIRTPWATAPIPMPALHDEYDATVATFVRTYNDNPDVQRGDPAKMAQVILRLVEEPRPPVRLLLGSDAAWLAPLIAQARAGEDDAWREVTLSTDLDGLGDFAATPVAQLVRP
jgi:NAD(P)-dependent dehydrogenase (short-subunit alcohol dehydrogenase family)